MGNLKKISGVGVTFDSAEKKWWTKPSSGGYNCWTHDTYQAWTGSCLPNCTSYCYGYVLKQFNLTGVGYNRPWTGNAKQWKTNAVNKSYGSTRLTGSLTQTPTANSIMVWSGNTYGHVAICTAVNGNRITTRESGKTIYTASGKKVYCRECVWDTSNGYNYPLSSGSYTFLGFIPILSSSGGSGGTTDSSTTWSTNTTWKGSTTSYLSEDDMKVNAQIIAKYCESKGWDLKSCCALLGNIQQESTLNPLLYEGRTVRDRSINKGYGLIQWTPANVLDSEMSTLGITTPSWNTDATGVGNKSLRVIQAELDKDISGYYYYTSNSTYKVSGKEFYTNSKGLTLNELVECYCYNRERAGTAMMSNRKTYASNWYNYLLPLWGKNEKETASITTDASPIRKSKKVSYIYSKRREVTK